MIFFDIDRTLFDYDHAVERAMEDFYVEFGTELNTDFTTFRQRWVDLYDKYWPQYELGEISLKDQRIKRMQGLFEDQAISTVQAEKYARFHNDAYVSHWRLFPDATELLDDLKGRQLGVISNGNVIRQRAKLEHTGILDLFEVVVVSAEYGYAKPDERIFQKAMELAGAHRLDSTHIGDNLSADVAGAEWAGLKPIWINRTGATSGRSDVREVKDLKALIGEL